METTKTTITKTTQEKQVPTVVFNDDSLKETLMEEKRSNFVEIVYTPKLTAKKTNNRFWDKLNKTWTIEKISRVNGQCGHFYVKRVQKVTNNEEFKAQQPLWFRHWSRIVVVNKREVEYTETVNEIVDGEVKEVEYVYPIIDPKPTKFYIAFEAKRADNVYYRYVDSKEKLTDEEVKEYKSFITPTKSQPIVWRTVAIENIRELRINGIRYQRGS